MGLVLIGWVGPKINEFGPNRLGLGLGSGLDLNRLDWT